MTSLAMQPTYATDHSSTYSPMSLRMQIPPTPPIPQEAMSGPADFVLVEVKITLPNGRNLKASGKLSTSEISIRQETAINCIEEALVEVTKHTIRKLRNCASMVLCSIGH